MKTKGIEIHERLLGACGPSEIATLAGEHFANHPKAATLELSSFSGIEEDSWRKVICHQ